MTQTVSVIEDKLEIVLLVMKLLLFPHGIDPKMGLVPYPALGLPPHVMVSGFVPPVIVKTIWASLYP